MVHVDWLPNFHPYINFWKILDFEFLSFLWLGISFFRGGKCSFFLECLITKQFLLLITTSQAVKDQSWTANYHDRAPCQPSPSASELTITYTGCSVQLKGWCRYSFCKRPFQRVVIASWQLCGVSIVFSWHGNTTRISWMFFRNNWFEMRNLGFSSILHTFSVFAIRNDQ